jgi:hypothetical protein
MTSRGMAWRGMCCGMCIGDTCHVLRCMYCVALHLLTYNAASLYWMHGSRRGVVTRTIGEHTMTTHITSFADARAELEAGIKSAYLGNSQSAGAIARVAHGLLAMIAASNNGETTLGLGVDGARVDVHFNAETLGRYANKALPAKSSDATPDMPTANMMIAALGNTSETVRNAQDALAAAKASEKAAKNPLNKYKYKAEAEKIAQALNTFKAPIRRAMLLAAYIANNEEMDHCQTAVKDGVLYVQTIGAEDGDDMVAVTFSEAREEYAGTSTRPAKSQGGTSKGAENAPEDDSEGYKVAGMGGARAISLKALPVRLREVYMALDADDVTPKTVETSPELRAELVALSVLIAELIDTTDAAATDDSAAVA